MQKTIKPIALAVVCVVLTGAGFTASAQKLPNVQEGSVYAPAKVKIDARIDEWGDMLQADNKTTDIFYTVANDDKNLYLIIKSTNQMINNKILAGGINYTINTTAKKKDKDAFVVTFPLVDPKNLRNMMMQRMGGGPGAGPQQMDSARIASMRKSAVAAAKEIKLVGFKDVADSVVSIYNEYGIKAALDYDRNGSLVSELAIPLKYLGSFKELAYNIKLNGLNINAMFPGAGAMMGGGMPGGGNVVVMRAPAGGGDNIRMGGGGGGDAVVGFGGGRPPAGMPSMSDMQNMISPTDFWGKYVLAKK
jgi:hypothetical protein